MSEEIKIITLGDVFKNIETEEKAFKFKDYIKDLQQKAEQLENIRKEAAEYCRSNEWAKDYENSNCRTHLLNILNKGSE